MSKGILFTAAAGAMVLIAFGAPLVAASHPIAGLALRGFFSRLCDQDPARSFVLEGSPVAVCVRCLGIYCGAGVGAALGPILRVEKAVTLRIFLSAVLLSILDAAAETCHLHGNMPLPRFFLGVFLGFTSGVLLTLRFRASKAGDC